MRKYRLTSTSQNPRWTLDVTFIHSEDEQADTVMHDVRAGRFTISEIITEQTEIPLVDPPRHWWQRG